MLSYGGSYSGMSAEGGFGAQRIAYSSKAFSLPSYGFISLICSMARSPPLSQRMGLPLILTPITSSTWGNWANTVYYDTSLPASNKIKAALDDLPALMQAGKSCSMVKPPLKLFIVQSARYTKFSHQTHGEVKRHMLITGGATPSLLLRTRVNIYNVCR